MSKRCLRCMELYENEYYVCPHCGYVERYEAEEAILLPAGTLLQNRYLVGTVIGHGGFGNTYIGWDGRLECKVAIKEYMPTEFSTRMPGYSSLIVMEEEKGEQFQAGLSKFVEEARRLKNFQSEPGIVSVYDCFEENKTAYIVMEYLEGETLKQKLQREGVISEKEAIEIMLPIMHALEKVHEKGILHRDIAPDNIFLLKGGGVKLIDFGAARYATTTHSRSLTVIIKPGYSPEEQYRSTGDQGPHTDVYAIAATFYKMITGKTPPDALIRRSKYESKNKEILIEPHKLNKDISLHTENAILNAMNVRIEDRTPTMTKFIQDLESEKPVKRIYGKIKKIDLYRWPLWLKIASATVAGFLLVMGILLATGVISFSSRYNDKYSIPEGYVEVPNLIGCDFDEAKEILEKCGLGIQRQANLTSEFFDEGIIIQQSPGEYKYVRGGENGYQIMVWVSRGVPQIIYLTVPGLVGELVADATKMLNDRGLPNPEIEEEVYDNEHAIGTILEQSVPSGTEVEENTIVKIKVCCGAKDWLMPNLVDSAVEPAEQLLVSKGILVEFREGDYNDDIDTGKIEKQSIAPGDPVSAGDKVILYTSKGKKQAKEITVTLDPQGGTVKNKTFKIKEGEVFDLEEPVRKGYTFDGWFTKAKGGTQIKGQPAGDKDVTFYAHWTKIEESKPQKPSVSPSITPKPVITQKPVITPKPEITKSPSITPKPEITKSPSITPKPETKTFIVTYNANGGSGAPSIQLVIEGKSIKLSSDVPTRSGYNFLGWSKSATASSASYQPGATFSTTSNVTLYAVWEAGSNYLDVKFRLDGASSASSRSYGVFDVYINGKLDSENCTDYHKKVPYGSNYEIKNIRATTGHSYDGVYSGTLNGTMGTGNVETILAFSTMSFRVSWNNGTGYSVSVSRTSSAVGSTGGLSNGATIYYGDVLSVSYTASAGYMITSRGATSVTVTGDVTSSTIYATASADAYEYVIRYVSSNGTNLGTAYESHAYGTTHTIYAPSKSGYNTPAAQTVAWDSTSQKTITFVYTPSSVSNATISKNVYKSDYTSWDIYIAPEYQNRTATSVQVRLKYTFAATYIKGYWFNEFRYDFTATVGGVSMGNKTVVPIGTWPKYQYASASRSAYSDWVTISLNTTNQVNLSIANGKCIEINANGNSTGNPDLFSGSMTIPAY